MPIRRFSNNFRRFKSRLVDIQLVDKNRFPEAVRFMRNNYLDDPFMRSMGVSKRHTETHNFLSALWLTLLRSELSLAAIYRNKICGLCINCSHIPGYDSQDDILLDLAKLVKLESTRRLLLSWDKINREVKLQISPTNKINEKQTRRQIIEVAGLAVAPEYRQLGIANKLIQNAADLGMLLGFEYIRVDCTNMVTANICQSLGWRKICEIPFESFDFVLDNHLTLSGNENRIVQIYFQPLRKISSMF